MTLKMTRALFFERTGEPREVLRVGENSLPPQGERDLLIQVAARPIQPADWAFIRGQYRIRPVMPQTAGLEGSGTVIAAGSQADVPTGTRVAFRWPGTWAEYAVVPSHRAIRIPADISDDVACQMSLNPVTAWALLDEVALSAGDWLLLTAAASTVSNLVASLARRRGIHVIGVVRGDAATHAARSLADHVYSADDPELASRILGICGDARIAGLLDSVGGPLLSTLIGTLAPGGRIVAYGVQDRAPALITNAAMIYSNLSWKGFGIDRWLSTSPPDKTATMFDELWRSARDGTLSLPVAARYELARFGEALEADLQPGRRGKIVLS
jgi:NADPH:quinone reductase-like Zn-dependent oxidoreductase